MKISVFLATIVALVPLLASAQTTPAPLPGAAPVNVPANTPAGTPFDPTLPPVNSLPAQPASIPPAPPAPATRAAAPGDAIRLNFKNAALSDVLSYLSSAAGFIILQEEPVSGTVNIVSAQPVTADEAVDLLNAVLVEKGYLAMRTGRILKIVSRQDAEKRDLPVMSGSNPDLIPRKDNLVTQILPVRYADVTKLIDNLSPLLPTTARITSNVSSNAIVLTDTQTDIHRVAEIIRALDTSISGISTIHVFTLRYADAKSLADVLTQLFSTESQNNQNNNNGFNPGFFFGGGRFGGGGGGGGGGGNRGGGGGESEARRTAARVVATADQPSNSVIVSAPEEYLPTITDVVNQLDTNTSDITETRIFPLEHADANELATILSTLYSDSTTPGGTTQAGNQRGGGGNGRNNQQNRPNAGGGGGNNQQGSQLSERALQQARVAIVPDPRTNAVIVSASHDTMAQIAVTVGRLDSSSAKKQHVHVYTLGHADPDNVASILKSMFTVDATSGTVNAQPSLSRLTNRTTTGASSDVADALNTNSNSGSSSGR